MEDSKRKSYIENSGWKHQFDQLCLFPYIRHLVFGDKKDLLLPYKQDDLTSLVNYLSNNKYKYQQFLRQKGRNPSLDIYACFQPFNEAFKALYPFVEYIREQLEDGDYILNLWDRSGWTASMLGGWFPKQHIITVWEGDKDILGYRGFDYWMSPERRHNHTVLFADFLRPLPLENSSVSAVIGFDLLHRFYQPELLSEIHRIAKSHAPIIFPHVHLTNSMPEPFFDRGCRQLHGNDYQHFFNETKKDTKRSGYILSEPATFIWNDTTSEKQKTLVSNPDNPDYNACIAWLSTEREDPFLQTWRGHEQIDWEQMYLLQNPLLTIDPFTHSIKLREDGWGDIIYELLATHPVYAKKTEQSIGKFLEEDLRSVLYWALQGLQLHDIIKRTGLSTQRMHQLLQRAWELDLAQAVPVDEAGFRLQTLLGQQQYLLESGENNLFSFWEQAVAFYADEQWCKVSEDEALTYAQADELIKIIQKALSAEGLSKGDKVLICAEIHSEPLLMFWAAASMGIVIVPLSPKQAAVRLSEYVSIVKPALALAEPSLFGVLKEAGCERVIMIDHHDDPAFEMQFSFESWLEMAIEKEFLPISLPGSNDIAAILWTTGSTDNPKGIPITHSQLIRSGRLMTETYHWKKTDKYFALGGLETMSGLRHATVSIAEAGASCVIPVKEANIYVHLKTIITEKVTILTANPVYYKQLLLAARSADRKTALSIRLALCTGNQLRMELRQLWQEYSGVPLYNYYGLTETSGICIAEPPGFKAQYDNSIGLPIDCLIKVLDKEGQQVANGMPGELCIYGINVFNGYFENPVASLHTLKDGWFRTGDLVIQHPDRTLMLCGRISDIVKLPSGSRLEVRAIEEVIEKIPNILDWAVCPVREWEKETIALFVVIDSPTHLDETIISIRQAITAGIGSYAIPSFIGPVSFIPRGNHNKVLRKELLDEHFKRIKIS